MKHKKKIPIMRAPEGTHDSTTVATLFLFVFILS